MPNTAGFSRLLKRQLRVHGMPDAQMPKSADRWRSLLTTIDRTYDEFDQMQQLSQHADRVATQELERARALLERERDALVNAMRDRGTELQQVRDITGVGNFRLNVEAEMMSISESLALMLGFPEGAIALSVNEYLGFFLPADRACMESTLRRLMLEPSSIELDVSVQARTGDIVYLNCRLHSSADPDGSVSRIQGAIINVTEQHLSSFKIRHLAFHDELTGLPNRAHYLAEIEKLVEQGECEGFAVFFLDLDGFKEINDSLGHEAGDELLRELGSRLRIMLRDEDLVARFGGDEFVLLLPDCVSENRASEIAERVLQELSRPMTIDDCEVRVSASIGVSFYPQTSMMARDLLKQADTAMYMAKKRGRNRWVAFDANLSDSGRLRAQTLQEIREGLEKLEFEPYFQPIVDGGKSTIIGLEVLARWNHPSRGLLEPISFLDLAEQHGLIDEIGDRMLHAGVMQLKRWRDAGASRMYLSVNVSPYQLTNPEFLESVRFAIQDNDIPAQLLQLEITESCVMRDPIKGLEALHALAALGVRLALDDFGTGYSCLSTLQEYPVHTIKLDRSIVAKITSATNSAPLVSAVAALAHSLGFELIAEGVETHAQQQRLLDYGYVAMQGHLFFRPMVAGDVAVLLGLNERQNCSVSTSAWADAV
jgi:diguanylate cyclase (GGDEF)-like protein